MGNPEDKAKRQKRIKNRIAYELRTPKYKQRRVDSDLHKKKNIRDITNAEFVEMIQECDLDKDVK